MAGETRVTTAELTTEMHLSHLFAKFETIIRLTVKVEIPDTQWPFDGHSSQGFYFRPEPMEDWHFTLSDYMMDGIHAGLGAVEAPLPSGGIAVSIIWPTIYPSLTHPDDELPPTDEEVARFGRVLERMVAGAVEVLWRGMINLADRDV